MFVVTEEILKTEFDKMNRLFFEGLLEVDVLEIDDLDTEWGFCVDDEDEWVLGVTSEFPSERFFKEILLHEMAHLYQINFDLEVNHGETFKKICEMYHKEGFNVS